MANTTNDRPARTDADAPVDSEQLARQQAIKQIERRRHYWITTAISTVGMLVLATIWAITEYHNAGGGQPTDSAKVLGFMTSGTSGSSTRPSHGRS